MSVAFKRTEMIGATFAAKNFGKVVTDLATHKKEKTVIVKNNELSAVILPIDEYERMAELAALVEHLEIYDLVSSRAKTKGRKVSLDRLLKEQSIDL